MSMLSVRIDASAVERLAGTLGEFESKTLGEASRKAVNDTADRVYDLARPKMIEKINLTDEYVRSRMQVKHATATGKAEAVIVASGNRNNMTQLVNYGAIQRQADVNWSNERIAQMGIKFSKWPGWTKRTGDRLRGIPANQKAAGVGVSVTRGSNSAIAHGFLVSLSNGAGIGVATRSKGAKGRKDYKVRYGPSVYQLFRKTAEAIIDDATDMLETTLVEYATDMMKRQLA